MRNYRHSFLFFNRLRKPELLTLFELELLRNYFVIALDFELVILYYKMRKKNLTQTDAQTHRHTDVLIAILRLHSRGRSNNRKD